MSRPCRPKLLLILALPLVACRPLPPEVWPSTGLKTKIALLPVENNSGNAAPMKRITTELREQLQRRGLLLVPAAQVDAFLSRRRMRYTAGVGRLTAAAARDELGADAILISALQGYDKTGPRQSMLLRLVSTGATPRILWIDGVARAGDEAPGLFARGVLRSASQLRQEVMAQLARSLAAFLAGRAKRAVACASTSELAPEVAFLSPRLDGDAKRVVAVLPFHNRTEREEAGSVLTSLFVRQLLASNRIEVLDPGVVRDLLLEYRIILQGGVALNAAQMIARVGHVDAVVSGTVFDYRDDAAPPKVGFSALMLDGKRKRLLWRFVSTHQGDDGVFFFDVDRIATAEDLACRMIATALKETAR